MNGLLEGGSDEPWDRVWSVEEMRGAANDWSLACDAGVMISMGLFTPSKSDQMTSKKIEWQAKKIKK